MDGWADGFDGWMDRWMDGWMDGWMDALGEARYLKYFPYLRQAAEGGGEVEEGVWGGARAEAWQLACFSFVESRNVRPGFL